MEKTDLRETVSFKAAVLVILAAAVVFAFILGNVVERWIFPFRIL